MICEAIHNISLYLVRDANCEVVSACDIVSDELVCDDSLPDEFFLLHPFQGQCYWLGIVSLCFIFIC